MASIVTKIRDVNNNSCAISRMVPISMILSDPNRDFKVIIFNIN